MHINVIFQTVSFYFTQAVSVSHSYLCIWWTVAELSINNLPQSAQTLDFYLKSHFVQLHTSGRFARGLLVPVSFFPRVAVLVVVLSPSQSFMLCVATPRVTLLILDLFPSNFSSFVLLNTSSCSARCRLVQLSAPQSLLLWFAEEMVSLSTLLACLDCLNCLKLSSWFVLNTSTRSARCPGYLNTLTFVGPVLASFYPLC